MTQQFSPVNLTALFNSMSAGFVYLTNDGTIDYCNDTAAALFQSTPAQMTGTKFTAHNIQVVSELGLVLPPEKNSILLACKEHQQKLDQLFHICINGKDEAWIRCNIEPIYDVTVEDFAGSVLSFVEVTNAVLAKHEQKENEEKYHHHFTFNEGATFLATKDGQYLGVSRGAEKMFGYTQAELKALGRTEILVEDERFLKALEERDRKGRAFSEVTAKHKSGRLFPVLWYATLFTTSSGDELVSVTMIDVSETKAWEHNAKTLDYNLQLILDNTDEAFILLDEGCRVVTYNKAAATAFKRIHNKVLKPGKNIRELFSTVHKKELDEVLADVEQGESREMQRVFHLNQGGLLAFQSSFRPLHKNKKLVGVIISARDITRKYKIQRELEASNERYKRAALASYDILWEHDLQKHQLYFSESFAQTLGYPEPITTLPAQEFSHRFLYPDDMQPVMKAVTDFLKSGETHFDYPVHRLVKKDGSFIFVEAQVIVSRNNDGEPFLLTGVTRDITERYLMETQLRESNERYRLVAKATSDVVWDWNLQTNSNWFSENFAHLFGYASCGNSLSDWEEKIHPEDRPAVLKSIKKAIDKGQTHWQREYRFRHADGHFTTVYDRGYTIYNAENKPCRMIGAMQDISELKTLQQKMAEEQLKAQKEITNAALRSQEAEREELGIELHDNINQILATCKLLLNLGITNKECREEVLPKTYDYLNKAIEEIRVLSSSLVPPSLGTNGLAEAVQDLVNTQSEIDTVTYTLDNQISKNLVLTSQLQLMAYRIVQEQLNNIGKYAQASTVHISLAVCSGNLHIRITDNGIGFNEGEKRKGIGLRNMKSRAEANGGQLKIFSCPGEGCRLEVTIPLT